MRIEKNLPLVTLKVASMLDSVRFYRNVFGAWRFVFRRGKMRFFLFRFAPKYRQRPLSLI